MSRNRWTLNTPTKCEYARLVTRMRAAGAVLETPEFNVEWIKVRHCSVGSAVRTWSNGTVFVIYVRVVGMAPKTVIRGFELWSPEWDFDAYILEDPSEGCSPQPRYRMLDGSRFDRSEILNHRLDRAGILRAGDAMEGWVLAECLSEVPSCYNRSKLLPLSLSIVNQFDEAHTFSFEIPVERITRRIKPRAPRGTGLFEPAPKPAEAAVEHPASLATSPDQGKEGGSRRE